MDWPQETELKKTQLVRRVEAELESLGGKLVIILQKFRGDLLAREIVPMQEKHSPLVPYVIAYFEKAAQTAFFELYK